MPFAPAAAPRDHLVTFYESDEGLAEDVASFLAEGFVAGDAAVVVATPDHRRLIEAALRRRSLPVDSLREEGRFVLADAAETLASLVVGDTPDHGCFSSRVGGLVSRAAGPARRVRAFGEMVGLLWERGDVASATALESFWNELCLSQDLTLFCAYPAASLTDADLRLVHGVCAQHSEVRPPACWSAEPGARDGSGAEKERSRLFLPVPVAPRAVRRFVTETLRSWGAAALVDDAALVATELTTNALRHARSPFRMRLRLSDVAVAISVHDVSSMTPKAMVSDAEALSGRGLAIVGELSSYWGTEVRSDGKVVWATLAVPA